MPKKPTIQEQLLAENEDLRARLDEAEEALHAIRSGEVDALVVSGAGGERVFTLKGADHAFRVLIEEMNEGALTLTAEGVILYANRRFAEMLKTPLEKVIASTIHTWIAPDDQPILQSLLRQGGDERRREELVLSVSDGTLVPVSLSVSDLLSDETPDCFGLVATDLTKEKRLAAVAASEKLTRELLAASDQSRRALLSVIEDQKRAEADLRTSARQWRTTFDAMSDAVCLLDLERKILRCNTGARDIIGKPCREIVGWSCCELLHDTSEPVEDCPHVRMRETGRRASTILALNGRSFNVAVDPLLDEAGNVTGAVHVMSDITNRIQAEDTLRETNERLRQVLDKLEQTQWQIIQQERLRAFGQMASGIAHDFNNALSQILGFTELLLNRPENLADKDKTVRYLELMRTAASDAAEVVRRMREFYRPREEDERFSALDLAELVEESISLTQPRWRDEARGRGVDIAVIADLREVPAIEGNAPELREALTNLIFNAVDAMDEGGTITVRTRSEDNLAVLEVADTGTGMTDRVRASCLEPFFSTKGDRGTGLGLAAVHGVVGRHNGTIEIQSKPGTGTTFVIRLPVPEKPADAAERNGIRAKLPDLRVLLVEDEERLREILTEYLAGEGYEVETAADGREGLQKFRAGRFDLVITDLAMPEMSGDQMVDVIRTIAPDKPVIMLTGFGAMMVDAEECPPGVSLVVPKPVTLAALRKAVSKAMGG